MRWWKASKLCSLCLSGAVLGPDLLIVLVHPLDILWPRGSPPLNPTPQSKTLHLAVVLGRDIVRQPTGCSAPSTCR